MAINWGLAEGNPTLEHFQLGLGIGNQIRQRREERDTRNALAAYANDPGEETLKGVMASDPRLGIQLRGQMQQQRQAEAEQRRADLPMVGKLLEYAQDEQTYQQALGVAQQYGIDTSGLPQTYDPQWVTQQRNVLKVLSTPQGQQAASDAGKKAIDAGYQPGTPEYNQVVRKIIEASLAQPYMGSGGETRLYTPNVWGGQQQQPAAVQAPPQSAIEALRRGEGTPEQFDELFGPGAAARVMGGTAGNGGGSFR